MIVRLSTHCAIEPGVLQPVPSSVSSPCPARPSASQVALGAVRRVPQSLGSGLCVSPSRSASPVEGERHDDQQQEESDSAPYEPQHPGAAEPPGRGPVPRTGELGRGAVPRPVHRLHAHLGPRLQRHHQLPPAPQGRELQGRASVAVDDHSVPGHHGGRGAPADHRPATQVPVAGGQQPLEPGGAGALGGPAEPGAEAAVLGCESGARRLVLLAGVVPAELGGGGGAAVGPGRGRAPGPAELVGVVAVIVVVVVPGLGSDELETSAGDGGRGGGGSVGEPLGGVEGQEELEHGQALGHYQHRHLCK